MFAPMFARPEHQPNIKIGSKRPFLIEMFANVRAMFVPMFGAEHANTPL